MNKNEENYDSRISQGSTVLLTGASNSGKTFKIVSMLSNIPKYFSFVPEHIFYIHSSGCFQDRFIPLKDKVTFFSGWNDFPLEWLREKKSYILITDDSYQRKAIPEDDLMLKLATVIIHFTGSCLIIPIHNFFSCQLQNAREISLNSSIYFFLQSPSMLSAVKYFAHSFFAGQSKRFLEIYMALQNCPYQALMYDARPNCPEHLRLSSHFVPAGERSLDDIDDLTDDQLKERLRHAGPIYYVPKTNHNLK